MAIKGLSFDEKGKEKFLHFMKRRQLKDRMIKIIISVREQHPDAAAGISIAKDASYERITESIATCLARGLLDEKTLIDIFDDAELAGRQHVLLFQVPQGRVSATRKRLALNAGTLVNREFGEFLIVPTTTSVNVLADNKTEMVVKLVSRRVDWDEHIVRQTDDLIVVERRRTIERTSIIIKYSSAHNLLQIRIPPRGGFGIDETSRKVYLLALAVLDGAYGKDGLALLQEVSAFPLGDAYAKIVTNQKDFTMLSDSPESPHFRALFSRRGKGGARDIRTLNDYTFHAATFARTTIRGEWKLQKDAYVATSMHWERIKSGPNAERDIARIYFPHLISDFEVEHAIGRICEHAF